MRERRDRHDSLRPWRLGRAALLVTALVLGACGRSGSKPTIVQTSGIEIRAAGEPAEFRVDFACQHALETPPSPVCCGNRLLCK